MTTELGAAVIGLGVGEAHARAYAALPACRLRWVYDVDVERAKAVAAALPDARVASDLDCLLRDPAVDIVSIASYDDAHADQVIAALESRKHVFAEKPLCRTPEELKRVKRAWAAGPSLHVGSNLVLRAAPLFRWLKDAVAGGQFGEIYAFDGDYLYGRLSKVTEGWRRNVVDYSVLAGGGVHLVDLLLWVTSQRPDGVTASGNRFCTSGTPFKYQDFQAASFRFPSGLIGRISANFGCVHPHRHVVRIFGTAATFIHDDQGARLYSTRDEGQPPQRLELSAQPLSKGALIGPFVDRILRGTDSAPLVQHEFDVISACVAADLAACDGESHDVHYV